MQVSDYLEFGKEDTQEEKAAALASVVSVGEHCVGQVRLLASCKSVPLLPILTQHRHLEWGALDTVRMQL